MTTEEINKLLERYEYKFDDVQRKRSLEYAESLVKYNERRMNKGFNFSKAYIPEYELYKGISEKMKEIDKKLLTK